MLLNGITGFECFDKTISIVDELGKPFYYIRNGEGKRITFNLPKGEYYTENELNPLPKPLTYKPAALPSNEKFLVSVPECLTIIQQPNPHKASTDAKRGLIISDPSITEKPKPINVFIWLHEVGHTAYYTEWKCDVFAAYMMLTRYGYNPSQCCYSSHHSLRAESEPRKLKLFDYLLKCKVYE